MPCRLSNDLPTANVPRELSSLANCTKTRPPAPIYALTFFVVKVSWLSEKASQELLRQLYRRKGRELVSTNEPTPASALMSGGSVMVRPLMSKLVMLGTAYSKVLLPFVMA